VIIHGTELADALRATPDGGCRTNRPAPACSHACLSPIITRMAGQDHHTWHAACMAGWCDRELRPPSLAIFVPRTRTRTGCRLSRKHVADMICNLY
jgi:hypothetical protein